MYQSGPQADDINRLLIITRENESFYRENLL